MTWVNKTIQDIFVIVLGAVGSVIVLLGQIKTFGTPCFIAGSLALLITALYFRLTFFIALELIILAAYGSHYLQLAPLLQFIIPILLCVQLLAYYMLSGRLNNIFIIIGMIGISLLVVGYVYQQILITEFANLFIAFFSFYTAYNKRSVALIWAFLNTTIFIIQLI